MNKEAKKVHITEQICKQAQLMRKGGANQLEVAALLGINGSTVSRIEAAGFNKARYDEMRAARREKEAARKQEKERPKIELVHDTEIAEEYRREQEQKEANARAKAAAEEQVPGQMEMDLTAAEKPGMSEQVKLMRFQAAQVDKICMKLETIHDTLCMILRAVRKE